MLRVPGTMNFKDRANPKPVKILHHGPAVDWNAFMLALSAIHSLLAAPATATAVRSSNRPPSSAHEIRKHCPTLDYVASVMGKVSEPLWRSAIGVVKHTTEGEPLCHQWSTGLKFGQNYVSDREPPRTPSNLSDLAKRVN